MLGPGGNWSAERQAALGTGWFPLLLRPRGREYCLAGVAESWGAGRDLCWARGSAMALPGSYEEQDFFLRIYRVCATANSVWLDCRRPSGGWRTSPAVAPSTCARTRTSSKPGEFASCSSQAEEDDFIRDEPSTNFNI